MNAPARIEEAVNLYQKMGGKVIGVYLVMGEYDYVTKCKNLSGVSIELQVICSPFAVRAAYPLITEVRPYDFHINIRVDRSLGAGHRPGHFGASLFL